MSSTEKFTLRFSVLAGMILIAAFSRLIPHMTNFSPLAAIGLFGAAHFDKKWQAFLVPVFATWLSDLFINNVIYANNFNSFTWFYSGFYWQYGSYLLIVLAGIFIFRKLNAKRILAGVLTSTVIFFLVTNFGQWITNKLYSKDLTGLVTCYTAAIPYLKGTIMGDLFFSTVLFGSFYLLTKKFPALALTHKQPATI